MSPDSPFVADGGWRLRRALAALPADERRALRERLDRPAPRPVPHRLRPSSRNALLVMLRAALGRWLGDARCYGSGRWSNRGKPLRRLPGSDPNGAPLPIERGSKGR